jgi:hypothetical protein
VCCSHIDLYLFVEQIPSLSLCTGSSVVVAAICGSIYNENALMFTGMNIATVVAVWALVVRLSTIIDIMDVKFYR